MIRRHRILYGSSRGREPSWPRNYSNQTETIKQTAPSSWLLSAFVFLCVSHHVPLVIHHRHFSCKSLNIHCGSNLIGTLHLTPPSMSAMIRIPTDEGAFLSPAMEKAASWSVYSIRPPPLQCRLRYLLRGAPKLKLLLIGMLLFSIFAFFCWNLSFLMGWNLHRPSSASSPSRYIIIIILSAIKTCQMHEALNMFGRSEIRMQP